MYPTHGHRERVCRAGEGILRRRLQEKPSQDGQSIAHERRPGIVTFHVARSRQVRPSQVSPGDRSPTSVSEGNGIPLSGTDKGGSPRRAATPITPRPSDMLRKGACNWGSSIKRFNSVYAMDGGYLLKSVRNVERRTPGIGGVEQAASVWGCSPSCWGRSRNPCQALEQGEGPELQKRSKAPTTSSRQHAIIRAPPGRRHLCLEDRRSRGLGSPASRLALGCHCANPGLLSCSHPPPPDRTTAIAQAWQRVAGMEGRPGLSCCSLAIAVSLPSP